MPADENIRQAEFTAQHAHLVLEQFAQRLHQLHVHARGQAADIVMRLDGDRRPAGERHALDHVGIQRALRQKIRATNFLGFRIEHIDEQPPDGLALHFRIGDAGKLTQKRLGGVNMHQRNVVVMPEQIDDGFRLVLPQHAVIDEHAGELLADGFVNENGGHG